MRDRYELMQHGRRVESYLKGQDRPELAEIVDELIEVVFQATADEATDWLGGNRIAFGDPDGH